MCATVKMQMQWSQEQGFFINKINELNVYVQLET